MFDFQFDTLNEFLSMAGHGPYVWSAYTILFVVLAGLVVQSRTRKKSIANKIKMVKHRVG